MRIGIEPYKGYFIEGTARLIHPFSPDWNVHGTVLAPGRLGSIVEVTRFDLPSFTMSVKGLAEWFGLELARIVVDATWGCDRTNGEFISIPIVGIASVLSEFSSETN